MKKLLINIILVFALQNVFGQGTQTAITMPIDGFGHTATGWINKPSDYATNTSAKYPVIFFYHGSGEAGTNPNTLLTQGLPLNIANGMKLDSIVNPADGLKYSFIVVSLQDQFWSPDPTWLPYEMAYMKANYRVDTNRIYVTGLSSGGEESLLVPISLDSNIAKIAAAAVPMSTPALSAGTYDFNQLNRNKVKTWFFCGASDGFLTYSQTYNANANTAFPGSSTLTTFVGAHCCWPTYYDVNYSDPVLHMNIYQWMLQSVRGGAVVSNTSSTITITATITGATKASSAFTKAKYNAKVVGLMTIDDRLPDTYTQVAILSGGTDRYKGGSYAGYTFPDNTGGTAKYAGNIGVNVKNNDASTDQQTAGKLPWRYIDSAVRMHWADPMCHGWVHDFPAGFPGYVQNVTLCRQAIYDSTLFYGFPFVSRDWISPSNYDNYMAIAHTARFRSGTSQSKRDNYPGYPDADYLTYTNLDSLNRQGFVQQIRMYTSANSRAADITYFHNAVDVSVAAISTNFIPVFSFFSHTIDSAAGYNNIINYFHTQAAGREWVPTIPELYDYLETYRKMVKSESFVGGVLTIVLDTKNIPDWNRYRDISLLISTDGTISSITQTGADRASANTATGLVNIFKLKTSGFTNPNTMTIASNTAYTINKDHVYSNNEKMADPTGWINGSNVSYYSPHSTIARSPNEISIEPADSAGFNLHTISIFNGNFSAITPKTYISYIRKVDFKKILLDSFDNTSTQNAWKDMTLTNPAVISRIVIEAAGAGTRYGKGVRIIGDYVTSYNEPFSFTQRPYSTTLDRSIGAVTHIYTYYSGVSGNTFDSTKFHALIRYPNHRIYLNTYSAFKVGDDRYMLDPTWGGWSVKQVLQAIKNYNGYAIINLLKSAPFTGGDPADGWPNTGYAHPPRVFGTSATSPLSYLHLARRCFQIAAVLGKGPILPDSAYHPYIWGGTGPDSSSNNNTIQKSLGYTFGMEPINEPDPSYSPTDYMTGDEIAAYMSACYDGDQGRLGKDCGIKTADSTIKVYLSGLALGDPFVLRKIRAWCIEHRGYKKDNSVDYPFDYINFHKYSSSGTRGVAPEAGGMFTTDDAFIYTSDKYFSSMPVVITEKGNDTSRASVNGTFPIGAKTTEQVQGDWGIRDFIGHHAHHIEASYVFSGYDESITDFVTKFGQSGVLNMDNSARSESFFVDQINKLASGYNLQDTALGQYHYTKANNPDIYIFWSGTMSGATRSFTIFPGTGKVANLYPLTYGTSTAPLASSTAVTSSGYSVTAPESPYMVTITLGGVQLNYILRLRRYGEKYIYKH